MNYKKHYDAIIERSKTRQLSGYVEIHHIIPKCMNGSDNQENLAVLTAREHFVCHQLLAKMFPGEHKLIYAAYMMTVGPNRITNRVYEWLKIKYSVVCSTKQKGSTNTNYGKRWYTNGVDAKCLSPDAVNEYIAIGWYSGRTNNKTSTCKTCSVPIQKGHRYCDKHKKTAKVVSAQHAAIKVTEDQIVGALRRASSVNNALKILGITNWYRVSKIAKKYNISFD